MPLVYEEAFNHTGTKLAPWYIIPDNHHWFARACIASIILAKLKTLHSKYPATALSINIKIRCKNFSRP
jgi:hypothetical protein